MARETREVVVMFSDEPESHYITTVAIDGDWVEEEENEEDDYIFYYFTDEATYKDALINGTQEFKIKELSDYDEEDYKQGN